MNKYSKLDEKLAIHNLNSNEIRNSKDSEATMILHSSSLP